jgi:hypothetical protein
MAFMKYGAEMGPGAMLHIPSFMKIGYVRHLKVDCEGGGGQIHRWNGDRTNLTSFLFSK